MADIDVTLNYDAFCDQVEGQLRAAFPDFGTVAFDLDDEDENIATPALLLELVEAEPDLTSQAGTGQLPALLRVEARIVMGVRTPQVKRAVRKAALALAAWLHNRRWGPAAITDPCAVLACSKDDFDPSLDKFAVWRVEWNCRAYIGETDTSFGDIPRAFFSFSPVIGKAHQGEYTTLPEATQ